jgi:hypothetical protein
MSVGPPTTVRFDIAQRQQLDALARKEGTSRSAIVRRLLHIATAAAPDPKTHPRKGTA